MQHGTVISSPKGTANHIERTLRQLAGEIHCNLSGKGNVFGSSATCHVCQSNVVVFGDLLLNAFDTDGRTPFLLKGFTQELLS